MSFKYAEKMDVENHNIPAAESLYFTYSSSPLPLEPKPFPLLDGCADMFAFDPV